MNNNILLNNDFRESYSFWIFKNSLQNTVRFLIETFQIESSKTSDEVIYDILKSDENNNLKFEIIRNKTLEINAIRDSDDSEIFHFAINSQIKINETIKQLEKFLNV